MTLLQLNHCNLLPRYRASPIGGTSEMGAPGVLPQQHRRWSGCRHNLMPSTHILQPIPTHTCCKPSGAPPLLRQRARQRGDVGVDALMHATGRPLHSTAPHFMSTDQDPNQTLQGATRE